MKKICLVCLILSCLAVPAESKSLGTDYSLFKYWLKKNYGLDYGIDVTLMPQRGTPSGKYNAFQTYLYPYLSWTHFKNKYGTGTLNMAYTLVYYGNHDAATVSSRMGVVSEINDYADKTKEFDEFYYSFQPAGKWNWLSLNIGQFPLYNFDGSEYNSNQQVNFINYALSQNASSTYPTAGFGIFAQMTPNEEWSFALGGQDATNVDAVSVRLNHLNEKHYTTFGQIEWTPTNKLGQAQISVLLYNQPAVKLQPQTTNGWSINFSQNIGEEFNIFVRINGTSGHMDTIEQSWAGGFVWLNPLNRNDLDQIGVAYAYNKINETAVGSPIFHQAEQVAEAYWAWGFSKWMTLTPDIQFYIHPATKPHSKYGAAFSLRMTLFL